MNELRSSTVSELKSRVEYCLSLETRIATMAAVSLLVFAASLKTYSSLVLPVEQNQILGSSWVTVAVIAFEFCLAIWFLSDMARKFASFVLIATYAVFSILNIISLIKSENACGCLGVFEVHPVVMLCIDVAIFGGLVSPFFLPRKGSSSQLRQIKPSKVGIGLVFACGIISFSIGLIYHPKMAKANTVEQVTTSKLIVIETDDWKGQEFPISDWVNSYSMISEGEWKVVLYRENCPKCCAYIEDLLKSSQKHRLAFIRFPPYKDDPFVLSRLEHTWLTVSDEIDWFIDGPKSFLLVNGIVKELSQ